MLAVPPLRLLLLLLLVAARPVQLQTLGRPWQECCCYCCRVRTPTLRLRLLGWRRQHHQCWQVLASLVLAFLHPLPPPAAVLGLHQQQGPGQEAAPEAAWGQQAWQGELGPLAHPLALARQQQQQRKGSGRLRLRVPLVVVAQQPCC